MKNKIYTILFIFLTLTPSLNFSTAQDDEEENKFEEKSKINHKLNSINENKTIQISNYAKSLFNQITDNETLTISILLLTLLSGLIIKYKRT